MEGVTFEEGVNKKKLILQEAHTKGAGDFAFRLHLFMEWHDRYRVFLSLIPGKVDDLPANTKQWQDLKTFSTLSYPM